MGTFRQKFRILPSGETGSGREVEGWADTGSLYTWVPEEILEEMGFRRGESVTFTIADGREVVRNICEARIELGGRVRTRICVFGDPGSDVLLGAETLEGFGMDVDVVHKRLVPVHSVPAVSQRVTRSDEG